jgi:hypothetical protein
MRTSAVALSLLLLAGCGSESDAPPPPLFGGFAPQDQTAVIFAPATCEIPFVGTTSVAAVAVAFTDFAGACDVLVQTQLCGTRASSTAVIGVAVSGLVGGGDIGPAGPGSYPFLPNPPTGAFRAIAASAARVDAACDPITGGAPDLAGGQIVLASVSDTAVTGSVDLRFDDGSAFQQAIDASVCALSVDACAFFSPCFDYVCAQPPG